MTDFDKMARKQVVVCAACQLPDGTLVCGPRHWDETMHQQMMLMFPVGDARRRELASQAEQGFVDQYGNFLTREEAREIVRRNGQPFDPERNGNDDTILFSEGLY